MGANLKDLLPSRNSHVGVTAKDNRRSNVSMPFEQRMVRFTRSVGGFSGGVIPGLVGGQKPQSGSK